MSDDELTCGLDDTTCAPEDAYTGPAPRPEPDLRRWGDPGFGGVPEPATPVPGKTSPLASFPFTSERAKVAAAAQEVRIGLAALATLRTKVIPAIDDEAMQLQAASGLKRIASALATADKLLAVPSGPDLDPVYRQRVELRRGYDEVNAWYSARLADLARARDYRAKVAVAKAAAATQPGDPAPKPGDSYSRHAAVPSALDLGKVAPGTHATEDFPIFNLVDKPVSIETSYQGDPALVLVGRPAGLPPRGQGDFNDRLIRIRFDAPEAKGTHRGTITVTYRWQYEVPDAETFQIPVVAHSMYPEDKTDAERAADATLALATASAAAVEHSEAEQTKAFLAEFTAKHPMVETDRFNEAVEHTQVEARRLDAKQAAGITLAEQQVSKYKRRLPPKPSHLWMDVAMFALDVASAGIAGRVSKALELGMLDAKIVERLGDGVAGPRREWSKHTNRAMIAMYTDSVKEAIKGGSKRGRAAGAAAITGANGAVDGDGDQNRDAAAEFFMAQRTALADHSAEREHGVLTAAAALRPLVYADEAAALDVLRAAQAALHEEASGVEAAQLQAQQSIEAWVSFLARNSIEDHGSPVELNKTSDVRDYHPAKKLDGVIDIGFWLGKSPRDPVIVKSARMLGVSDVVAARFVDTPLIRHAVTVRAYGLGTGEYADVPITVVRHADGRIEYTQQDMGTPGFPRNYLARKINRMASGEALGARKLIEDEIMRVSLRQHGVALEHDHDNG